MKKMVLFLLSILMVIGLCGCDKSKIDDDKKGSNGKNNSSVSQDVSNGLAKEIYAPARTKTNLANAPKTNLNNTAYKLKNHKKLNVVFFGGSITAGHGKTGDNGWSDLTYRWIRDTYSDAEVNYINSSIGGTSAYWGLFRAERDVLAHKPDLVFIEFAMNDKYQGFNKEKSTVAMEGLIRKITIESPETDIVIVLTTDKDRLGTEFENLQAHKEVAEYYGIPVINVGDALKAELDKTGREWSYYVGDIVHPNNEGYKIYANEVIKELKKLLPTAPSAVKKRTLQSETYLSNGIKNVTTISADQIKADSKWALRKSSTVSGIMKYDKGLRAQEKGAKLTFEFEGATFGMGAEIKHGASVKITIDGKEKQMLAEKDATNEVERFVFDNLAPGKHVVTIEYLGTAMFNIGAIFIG